MARPQIIREEHGVRLMFIDTPPEAASGTGGPHYRITSKRKSQAIVRVDQADALACFVREVAASRRDPMVEKILAAGL